MLKIEKKNIVQLKNEGSNVEMPLFYNPIFLDKKKRDGFKVVVLDFFDKSVFLGRFVYDENSKMSLPESSFGGLCLTVKGKFYFKEILAEIETLGLCRIVFSPNSYDYCPDIDRLKKYNKIEDVTVFLPLEGTYYSNLERSERKRYKKCKKEGFHCKNLTLNDLPEVYAMILETKNRKGYPGTLPFHQLEEMFILFPKEYRAFGCFDGTMLIAVMVNIKISDSVFYNFYLGDKIDYRNYSPIVLLLEWVYDYAQLEGGRILDLGLSSDNGKLNEGLHSFKLKLGGVISKKISFVKDEC